MLIANTSLIILPPAYKNSPLHKPKTKQKALLGIELVASALLFCAILKKRSNRNKSLGLLEDNAVISSGISSKYLAAFAFALFCILVGFAGLGMVKYCLMLMLFVILILIATLVKISLWEAKGSA